ncbi:hypothetical protein [Kurthia senegalensis]|uniref:hypothetical protein n=1 Tax=Kurthia senegalensis TaxID=1033740 RepID=UPI0002886229|nr:hypothetical protein [Kurthia senegalensis]
MTLLFGNLALLATFVNWVLVIKRKSFHWAMLCALAFTALTLCAQLQLISEWIIAEDWTALMDVGPTIMVFLWIATIGSIVLNGGALFYAKKTARTQGNKTI